jgi:peptide/nickel transport system substrate-binding protein
MRTARKKRDHQHLQMLWGFKGMTKKHSLMAGLAIAVLMLAQPAIAQELKIGLKTEPSSLDPHYHALTPNNQIAFHIFEALTFTDADGNLKPSLAASWKAVSDNVWEFKLRPNVKFSDGSPFTAEDVVFSLQRTGKVPNSPSPFTIYTKQVTEFEIVDPLTIRLKTAAPAPALPLDMSFVVIMSKKQAKPDLAEGMSTEGLNQGQGLVGTGPFKYVDWKRGNQLVLERNDNFAGEKPHWKTVTFRPMSNSAARVAAMLAGDVDLIEDPPTDDLERLKKDPKLRVSEYVSNRIVYIHFDHFAEPSVGIEGTNGKNPLKDKRVRQAMSLAIDREAIGARIMENVGIPAGGFLPYPMFGVGKDEKPEKYDLNKAKALLAEAGYPDGFTISLGSPNGRYINDIKVAQAIAAMWTRAGIKTKVDSAVPPVFFKNRDEYKYSAYLAGWSAGEVSNSLRSLVATPNREKGMGTTNKGRYSNPALDAKIEEALRTVDDGKRAALLQESTKIVIGDYALLPLHFEKSTWAMKTAINYPGRNDQAVRADYIKPAK